MPAAYNDFYFNILLSDDYFFGQPVLINPHSFGVLDMPSRLINIRNLLLLILFDLCSRIRIRQAM